MRLASSDVIAGFAASTMRSMMRTIRDNNGLPLTEVEQVLGDRDGTVLDRLVRAGYLEKVDGLWTTTIAGNAIAGAKFIRPISRAKAQTILDAFLSRVRAVNADPDRLYTIERVTLFGSFAKDADEVGDIDLSLRIVRRLPGEEHMDAVRSLIAAAPDHVRLSGIVGGMMYPLRQVLTFLKSRVQWLTIVGEDVSAFTDDYRTVYRHSDDPEALPFTEDGGGGDYPGTPGRPDRAASKS